MTEDCQKMRKATISFLLKITIKLMENFHDRRAGLDLDSVNIRLD